MSKTFTITVPDQISFKRQGMAFVADVANLSDEIAAHLFAHGLVQKVGDSAAGKEGDEAVKAMVATFGQLVAGEWTQRGVGSAVDPIVRFIRDALRGLMAKPAYASQKKAYKAFKEQADRDSYLDAWFAGLTDEQKAKINARAAEAMELERKKRESIAALGDDADFALQLPAESAVPEVPAAELIPAESVETPAKKAAKKSRK